MRDRLEDELRRALGREDPPAGFAERVLRAARERDARRGGWLEAVRSWFQAPAARWAAAVCLLVGVGVGIEAQRERLERARGEAARDQVMLALRIAGSKLQLAQGKVAGIGHAGRQYAPRMERQL